MIVYDIQDLVKCYPKQTQPVNDHITLQIYRGEIFGILGDNGAGKSTLIHQMVNLLRSTSGSIRLLGQDITKNPHLVPRYVGYMPQHSAALNNLTVGESLYFTAHLRGMSRAQAQAERERLLDLWELRPLRNKYSSRLSGGQARLLRLAVATAGSLPILILDEPTNDLDPQKRKLVWDNLRHLNSQQGTTIIFITHDALEAEKIIQRVAIMRDGRFVSLGRLSEIKQIIDQKVRLELFFAPETTPFFPSTFIPHEVHPGHWLLLLERDKAGPLLSDLRLEQFTDFRLYTASLEDVYLYYAAQQPRIGARPIPTAITGITSI
jgi:ABC-2 type transport system ATP-binding protein